MLVFAHQDGSLQNGDHLLAVGEVRLWGMGAEQVAAILRQAGQESIRLVVARPIDPSEPNYLINSAIVPTKVLSDPMELERTLQSGLLQSAAAAAAVGNGFDFNQQAAIAAVAAAAAVEANVNGDAMSTPAVTVTGVSEEVTTAHESPLMHNVPLPLVGQAVIPNGPVVESTPPPAPVCHPCIVTTDSTQPSGASTDIIVPTTSSTTTPSPLPHSPVSPTQSSSTTTICEADVHHQEEGETRAPSSSGTSCLSSTVNEVIVKPPQTKHRTRRKASSLRRATVMTENNSASSSSAEGSKLVRKSSVPSSMLLGPNPSTVDKASLAKQKEDAIDVVVVVEESCSEEAEKKRNSSSSSSSVKKRQGSLRSKKTRTKMVKCTEEMEKEMMATVLPEKEEYKIELIKDHAGLGITVAGYVCEKEDLCGIFVKNVIEGSSADKSGCIMANDQIIEVDGMSLTGISNQEAVEILKKTQSTVKMTIVRYLRGLRFQELQEGISQANLSSSASPISNSNSLTNGNSSKNKQKTDSSSTSAKRRKPSDKKRGSTANKKDLPLVDLTTSPATAASAQSPDPEIIETETSLVEKSSKPKVQSNHVSFSPQTVIPSQSSASAASPVVVDKDCELRKKWEVILGDKVEVLVANVSKPDQASGLGISLEGTVEVEDGKELRPRHYIRSILPGGPVDREGTLRSGDELLQVNDKRLKDLFHEEVVSNLRQLPAPSVSLVCARRKGGDGGDDDEQVFSPSPIRGTIVNNVDTGKSRQAFASRVS